MEARARPKTHEPRIVAEYAAASGRAFGTYGAQSAGRSRNLSST